MTLLRASSIAGSPARLSTVAERAVSGSPIAVRLMASLVLGLGLVAAPRLAAQPASNGRAAHGGHSRLALDDSATQAFVLAARAGSARYADPATALRDGFQPIGVETPGMGQHWVSAARVFRATFDAAQPAGLQYATVRGKLTLVGVAYLVPLLPGEHPPAFPDRHRWHMHSGTVDEETLIADHDAAIPATGARVAILHAWVWTENPAGVFAPDNWSLPFVRAGFVAPSGESAIAARALALASGGATHFTSITHRYGRPSARDSAVIRLAVADAAREATSVVQTVAGPSLTPDECTALEAIWSRLWHRIDAGVESAVSARLRPLRESGTRKEPTP